MPNTVAAEFRIILDAEEVFHEIDASLTWNLETKERETKDTVGVELRPGKIDWSISAGGVMTKETTSTELTFDALYAKFIAKALVAVEFNTPGSGDKYYTGNAYITSLEFTSNVNEDPTYSMTLDGSGDTTEATNA